MALLSIRLPLHLLLAMAVGRQTPEDLGFTASGEVAMLEDAALPDAVQHTNFGSEFCLDLGAKGFPLPVFDLLKEANWEPQAYLESLAAKGYADDALQMTGPQEAVLKSNCMREKWRGKLRHIFVGDSQMMTLRNALHRLNGCPEILYKQEDPNLRRAHAFQGRLHSRTEQAPDAALPKGCTEEGVASFIYWDAYVSELPVADIRSEIYRRWLDPHQDDVVVWVGSNYMRSSSRLASVSQGVEALRELGVKVVWDSPTYQDAALMAATTTFDSGRDENTNTPILYTAISRRKAKGQIGSNEYRDEKKLISQGLDIAFTKRWQLTNRYRGLQCDGIHTDMRGRDPLFFSEPCPHGPTPKYGASPYCMWVEPFRQNLTASCPLALGVDDLVLQSGLYALCNAYDRPFCYQHNDNIR